MSANRALARIQAKLDRWELEHLRQHARDLADRLEELVAERDVLRDQVANAEGRAEWWREQVMAMQEQLDEAVTIGITKDGAMGIVSKEAA